MFRRWGGSRGVRRARWVARIAVVAAGSLAVTSGAGFPDTGQALPRYASAPAVPQTPSVSGVYALGSHFVKPKDQTTTPYRASATAWPKDAAASIALSAPGSGAKLGAKGTATAVPVWAQAATDGKGAYSGPGAVAVHVLGQGKAAAAGISGVLLTVTPTGAGQGRARIGVDYATFAQAYGGNYASRLALVQYPACILSTPRLAACRVATPLGAINDTAGKSVSAQIPLAGAGASGASQATTTVRSTSRTLTTATGSRTSSSTVVLAATASASGGDGGGNGGTYSATTLKPSGSWSGGGSTGSFTYSYPLAPPPAASSLSPKLALSYDSGSVDGQTASTQAQSSWVGDGWSTPQSFVEQSFVSCANSPEGTASPVSTQDECYAGPVLTLSLNGSSTTLVWDSGKSVWRAQSENGAVVAHVTGSGNGTGTYNTDYWTVTERDGTVYSFGLNHLPGWASGKASTNSVDSEPVYSAHQPNGSTFTDPCYSTSGFTASVCTMAYRWNLDYVKDVHGNAMAYYYQQDTNYYGQDNGAKNTAYVRDSHLDHIDYGFTDGGAYGTVPDKVAFTTGDRCVSGTCDPLNSSTKANWPDVPYDLVCAAGASCTGYSPSFFSTVRLTSIATEQYSTATSSYVTVDSWALTQSMPATGDATSATLWLSQISHTGSGTSAGGSTTPITLPPVVFAGIDLQNRVDTTPDGGLPALYRFRISSITTESGSVISPTYDRTAACTAPVTLSPASNTSSCYPVYWTPTGYTTPLLDWFNKWVVTKVTATDPTGGAAATATSYQYNGGAAWHYDDNEVVQAKYRTYGQFRGYGDVITYTGDGVNDKRTQSQATYYRGMSNDNNTTAVTLTDSQGGAHDDTNQLAGRPLETTSYLGEGGPVDHSTITSYWVSAATATRTRTALPALTANLVAPVETFTRQALTDAGTTTWRYQETDQSYDSGVSDANFGLLQYSYAHTVPAAAAYDACTANSYAAANTGANLVGLIAASEVDSVACAGFTEPAKPSAPASVNTLTAPSTVNRPAQVVSATQTFYDDPTFSGTQPTAPTKGDATMVRKAADYTSGAFTYQSTAKTVYDTFGRNTAVYDGNGNKTSITYTMNTVGLVTATAKTNALNQSTSVTLDPQRGLTLTGTDANNVVTTSQYDALGRVTATWLDSRYTPTNTPAANYRYAYTVSNTGITATTTQKMNEGLGYSTSTVIYDALLRPRQSQANTPQGGRMVTDTFYDTHGWKSATYNGWWDSATNPNTTLVSAANLGDSVPNQDFYTYDGLGRTVLDNSEKDGAVVSTTTTVYNGDRTTVIPPTGGITQATVTDPLGRSSELDQYTAAPTLNTPANTFTGIFSVTGGTTTKTVYGYDGHGNRSTVTDASNNTWTTTYSLLGQATGKADPDAGATSMVYDPVGNLLQSTDARGKTISFTYDALSRKTAQYDAATTAQSTSNRLASWVYDNSNNAVTGMTYPIGHLTTETSYSGGAAYSTQAAGFNVFGESLGGTVTIPSATEGTALGTTYTFSHTYTSNIGLLLTDVYPAAGGLAAETDTHGWNTVAALEVPNSLGTGLTAYANGILYDAYGRPTQETLGAGTNTGYLTYTYDAHTGKLKDQLVTRKTATPANVDEQAYSYDLAGNLTAQNDTRLGSTATAETQCYSYDQVDRLAAAWTATDNCAATPTTTSHASVGDNLAAASAYWTTWTFDALGQRTAVVDHSTTAGTDTTTTYTYNGNSAGQANTLTSTTSTGGTPGSTSYTYDAAGNTTNRTTTAQGSQTLGWDDAGRLSTITTASSGSSFIYDADGNVLLQKDPGTTVLYLPGEQLTLNTSTSAVTGTRYAALPGGGTAVRTGTGTNYTFEITTDQHGTGALYLDHTAQTPTWRQYTPYGAPRGTTTTWIDNRGFLNTPTDTATGLALVGARQYDPATGRFVSLDPILAPGDPQALNGYGYTDANPVGQSDPSGLRALGDGSGSSCDWNGTCSTPQSQGTDGSYVDVGGGVYLNTNNSHFQQLAGWGMGIAYSSIHSSMRPSVQHQEAMREWLGWCSTYPDACGPAMLAVLKAQVRAIGSVDAGDGGTNPLAVNASGGTTVLRGGDSSAGDAAAASLFGAKIGTDSGIAGLLKLGIAGAFQGALNRMGGGAPACNSFSGTTPVLMADGTSKPIGQITVGDKIANNVPAVDAGTGDQAHAVTAIHITYTDHDYTDVTIDTGHGPATLTGTAHHLYWDVTTRTWTEADQLRVGDLLQSSDGHTTVILALRDYTTTMVTYNLTIDGLHTYYVEAGNTPVLVHNASASGPGCGDPLPTQITGRTQRLTNSQATDLAGYLGFSPTKLTSSGQKVFTNGKWYITQDVDSHNGGTWKIATSAAGLGSKSTRTGTTDALLNLIGD